MDVFRFTKQSPRANDSTRRYRMTRGEEREHVGEIEVGGNAPEGDTVLLSVICLPVLTVALREDALNTARRFLEELVTGWGRQVAEVPEGSGWAEQPDGRFCVRLEYQVV
jgi:hypothetical protein